MELSAEGRQTCSSRELLEEGVDAGDNTEKVSNPSRKKVVRYCNTVSYTHLTLPTIYSV